MEPIRCIEGTKDYFSLDALRFEQIVSLANTVFKNYAYERIYTPIFENTELFARSIGTSTDIVEKEMYTFTPSSTSLTLRPEGTAGVMRAYIQHNLSQHGNISKLWYAGPMFRRERPQKGRQRQFHQVGVEALGSKNPLLDAELVSMALRYYENLGLGDVKLRLNSIGCQNPECRPHFKDILRESLSKNIDKYCKNCQNRYDKNILRIIDCKNPDCQLLSKDLPKSYDYLCKDCDSHFEQVREGIEALGGKYILDSTLVRGLDYYTKTVFEFTHHALGAQDAIGGGGRYDGLIEELGGKSTPGIGFALGVERIMIALDTVKSCSCLPVLEVFGVALGESAKKAMSGLLARLRANNISADMEFEDKSLKSQMRTANRRQALCCLILGENELSTGEIVVKDMRTDGGQKKVEIFDFMEAVKNILPVKYK